MDMRQGREFELSPAALQCAFSSHLSQALAPICREAASQEWPKNSYSLSLRRLRVADAGHEKLKQAR